MDKYLYLYNIQKYALDIDSNAHFSENVGTGNVTIHSLEIERIKEEFLRLQYIIVGYGDTYIIVEGMSSVE